METNLTKIIYEYLKETKKENNIIFQTGLYEGFRLIDILNFRLRKPYLNKNYKLYNEKIKVISDIKLNKDDSFELMTCKLYLLLNDISHTKTKLNELGYRKIFNKRNRKIIDDDVRKVIKNIIKNETNKYKKLVKIIIEERE